MGAPEIIWIVLAAMGCGLAIAKHGDPRGPHDAWSVLIGTGVTVALLYWGGFFTA